MFFVFGLLLLLLLLKMLVANSFDLWQKDSFFCAAEEVQESTDMYVFFLHISRLLYGILGFGYARVSRILVPNSSFLLVLVNWVCDFAMEVSGFVC